MANDDDEIGYRKPPKATRFEKGKSGNPKGRPKGAQNLATLVDQAVNETVQVTINGKRRSISKLAATVSQLANKAASGDPKAMRELLDRVQALEARAEAQASPDAPLSEADLGLLDAIAARLDRMNRGPEDV
jgi:Family of unknown function (DUF5681)